MDWSNDLSGGQNYVGKNIRFKTLTLRSDLCDYGNAYTVVKWKTTVTDIANANSSIVNEGQSNFKPLYLFIFFDKKISRTQKVQKA